MSARSPTWRTRLGPYAIESLIVAPHRAFVRHRPVAASASSPVWARNGQELFYLAEVKGDRELMARSIGPDGTIGPRGVPLFRLDALRLETYGPVAGFDVSLDGQRFLFAQHDDTPPPPPPKGIHIVENWVETLKATVRGK